MKVERKCFIPKVCSFLGQRLVWLTLQLHEARCELRLTWEDKYLTLGVEKMINDLHAMTVPTEESPARYYEKENFTENVALGAWQGPAERHCVFSENIKIKR
jgi:hypothetical protein